MSPREDSKSERTRRRIRDAAAELFASRSFNAVSTRAIAARAGVDAALIHHYFGSKEGLFDAVMAEGVDPVGVVAQVTAQPREDWGVSVVRAMERIWTSPAAPALRALIRRALSDSRSPLRPWVTRTILTPMARQLDLPEPEASRRAALVGSHLIGMIVARHLVGVEPLARLSSEEVVDLLGPVVQRSLTGEH